MTRWILLAGGVLSGMAVLLGAFGAHALKHALDAQSSGWFDTANHYLTSHAFALIACGLLPASTSASRAAVAFIVGIALFCGSLYVMTFTGITKLGMITPLGGLSFLIGWLFFCLSANTLASKRIKPEH